MNFDIFVLPFSIGLLVLASILLYRYANWIKELNKEDKGKIKKGLFSIKFFSSIKEIFLECLLHRRIFRVNPLLGYMHMSIAFGWFLLIIVGSIKLALYSGNPMHLPYEALFMEFFVHDTSNIPFSGGFVFLLDFLLLVVLSGITLALIKRTASKMFGMERTTKLELKDKVALVSLWLIFPVRLMAESFAAGAHGAGGFLTGTLGNFFAGFLPVSSLVYPMFWVYSIVLGVFFISVPFSRYMHIPTEILLIFLRNFGIKTGNKFSSFSEVEVNSCPRCGICIDKCQINTSAGITDTPAVYFVRSAREGCVEEDKVFNCLLCGRCKEFCPVGIDTTTLRTVKRKEFIDFEDKPFNYLTADKNRNGNKKADVLYFAGCMTHLTPKTKESMLKILDKAKINYIFLDYDGGACCGRPLIIAGRDEKAKELIEYNKNLIKNSNAKLLVTSCPICYKVFRENYDLNDIKVMHHTEYLLDLIKSQKIKPLQIKNRVSYHDPCELGRNSGIYEDPRELLKKCGAELMSMKNEKEYALCCGNSLGNLSIKNDEKDKITRDALKELTASNPDVVITACPLCKKTFEKLADNKVEIMDISEIVAKSI
ncbi:MAG: (Fe-S)-binding protein [Euryarchaeota archaeon HGW-Euryarchaeota-1]|nr:MAG: (Fe-S)-binding protein [Euryarchaeota archaeon HGW-Euryarchaeota-1]